MNAGRLILATLKNERPEDCDVYIAAVRSLTYPVSGWRWNEQIRELGPPPALHADRRKWEACGAWPGRWSDYERRYLEWMALSPCARLLQLLETHLRRGRVIALACWCEVPIHCHRGLIGCEMARRGVEVVFG